MNLRQLTTSRSIFYRGITLKEYLRKSSATQPNLEYKDDETILLDQNNLPVFIDDDFIHAEPSRISMDSQCFKNHSAIVERANGSRNGFYLPAMASGKQIKTKTKSYPTERNSTDTSVGSSLELRMSFLPSLEKKQVVIRERNITMASRGSSCETSCRKKVTHMTRVLEQQPEEQCQLKEKQTDSKHHMEDPKKVQLMKQRYNVRQSIKYNSNKTKYFDRVKSHAE